ncbi:MAG: SDR family NAD(P)-dependent oxidoreductase [Planctomycetota bacterium]|nr:SDR family NAD(P)-dependent oxidoreductase [Planctomycetota bacterium]
MTSKLDWPRFTDSMSPMEKLVAISRFYGSDADMVLAGGGNTSVKDGATMYVKASGRELGTIDADGFVAMKTAVVAGIADEDLGADTVRREERMKQRLAESCVGPQAGRRPSVEAVLHAMLPEKYVVHVHPTVANMLTCAKNGRAICQELFGESVLWMEYVDPGYTLAVGLKKTLAGKKCPGMILIQNHGLLACADTPEEVKARIDGVMAKIAERQAAKGAAPAFGAMTKVEEKTAKEAVNVIGPALRGLMAEGNRLAVARFDDSFLAMSLAGGAGGPAATALGPLSPDHIVYACSYPVWFEPKAGEATAATVERLRAAIAASKPPRNVPAVVIVKGVGLFGIGQNVGEARSAVEMYLNAVEVMAGTTAFGGISAMTEPQRKFIENWEAESYRKKLATGLASAGRAGGKVAIVTGAAQGFGLEIAQDLASQGACVALADINVDGAASAVQEICRKHGAGRAIAVAMNVTDPASVAGAIHAVVRAFGGFDLLVSNAGVLRAAGVKSQTEKDFDFVTAVNYKGYFLCVQGAAGVLGVEHIAKPDYTSDIIQINSKSGLQGSNRNFAYAGSKFGGIGLTQSFAMELIEDGVKVNSICPGNFFDGPLWSDPKNGLFVQYLTAGKVPGAKTIADVRRFYEEKVPMKRGCTTPDVMRAIYYLMEQQYETGQALPVTGGQVMLK